jgi:hypothetical protein
MEIFLERLLLELAAIAVQLVILGLVRWLRLRPARPAVLVDAM